MADRLYATLAETIADLSLDGVSDEEAALARIRSASDWIEGKFGAFIPFTEAKRFDGKGIPSLWVNPLLAVTSIVDDGTTLAASDYLLYPRDRHWPNGPYTRLSLDPDSGRSVFTRELDVIVITGRWGLYEESIATGAAVANATEIALGATSLKASNGAKVSPGMVLLIQSEQLLVTATEAPIDSTADTTEALDATEEEVDVNTGSLVNVGEVTRIEFEQMKVLDIAGNTLSVARGWNKTKRVSHVTASQVDVYRNYTVKRGVNGTTDAAHANGTAISRYIPPFDVNWLCRQIAGLMLKKAQSAFAGKVGNPETGEVFYLDELPKATVDKIKANYRLVDV